MLTNFDVYVVPMANPDGVENGLCKLTGAHGIDLPRDAVASTDPTAKALMRLVHEIKPAGYLDLHQWWLKRDWILSFVPEPEWTARLFVNLERLQSFDRGWQITTQKEMNEAAPDLRGYCFKRWATQAVSLSLVWGHVGAKPRTTSEMRSVGEAALKGFCAALK